MTKIRKSRDLKYGLRDSFWTNVVYYLSKKKDVFMRHSIILMRSSVSCRVPLVYRIAQYIFISFIL